MTRDDPTVGSSRGLSGRLVRTARELAQRAMSATIGSGLVRLGPAHAASLIAFLGEATATNAYLLGQLARGALADESVAGTLLGAFRAGVLEGVAVIGSNLVLSHAFPEAFMPELAQAVRETRWVVRVIVGPDDVVGAYMDAAGASSAAFAVDRRGQVVFTVDQATLAADARSAELRPALGHELERLMTIDLAMVREELGFDPFSRDLVGYRRAWDRRVAERRSWVVAPLAGPIQFKVDQAAVSPETIQLAGVYVAPSVRRRGLAKRALGEMCHLLVREVPCVSLYVNAANHAAIGLYETLGFEPVGALRTAWYR